MGRENEQLGAILLRGQRAVLELIATRTTLKPVLERLCRTVEESTRGRSARSYFSRTMDATYATAPLRAFPQSTVA